MRAAMSNAPDQNRQEAARARIIAARDAAERGAHARVPVLLADARAEVNDAELTSFARRYCEFFELPPLAAESSPARAHAWLGKDAGAELDALLRVLIANYREAGGEWEGVAMEQAFLLEPTMAHCEVFADWLQTRARARGEFIALQLAYAHSGLDRRGRARMEGLLRRHLDEWAAPFHERGAVVKMFRRGFPAVVDQGGASVEELAELGWRWRTVERVIGLDEPELRLCRHRRRASFW